MIKKIIIGLFVTVLLTFVCVFMFKQSKLKSKASSKSDIIDEGIVCDSNESILNAISNAKAGDTILIRKGTYQKLNMFINKQGEKDKYITFRNYPGEQPVFQHSTLTIEPPSKYLKFSGLKFKQLSTTEDKVDCCLKVLGGCSDMDFSNIELTAITSKEQSTEYINPFIIYGNSTTPISNINIHDCNIHDCRTGYSEALTLNGNVTDCNIYNCTIDNTGNIGIDIAGNYAHTSLPEGTPNQARNIKVTNNKLSRCNSPYATSAALYCDGSRDVTLANNVIFDSQCGICLGSEQPGDDVCNFNVYNNLILQCGIGLEAGAYNDKGANQHSNKIHNNTIICKQFNQFGGRDAIFLTGVNDLEFNDNIVYVYSNRNNLYKWDQARQQTNLNFHDNCWCVEKDKTDIPSIEKNGIARNPYFKNLTYTLSGDYKLKDNSPCPKKGVQY